MPFTPSPLRLNIFRLFVILSLTQLYRYTPEIFLFSTATFKYKYRAPLRRIGQEYSAKVAFSIFQSLKRMKQVPEDLTTKSIANKRQRKPTGKIKNGQSRDTGSMHYCKCIPVS